jgi:hypothetical protein
MKRIYSRIPYILSILATVVMAVGFQLLTVNSLYAQVQSAAFDSNCYQPILGVPSEIDSIYGSENQQHLGEFMFGFPPSKDFPDGSIAITGLPNTLPFLSFVPEGPSFNLHDLNAKLKKSNMQGIGKFGRFHDRKHIDFFGGNRIYWADDNGDYDSSRYTDLHPNIIGDKGDDINPATYAAFLTSDSVFDIVKLVTVDDTPYVTNRHAYIMFFQGGENLYNKGKNVFADSAFVLGSSEPYLVLQVPFFQGDFRGSGREDLITSDDSGNWFFYKNDPPFSMLKFANAIYNDTLFTAWENATDYTPGTDNIVADALSTKILPHPTDDAQDIMIRGQFHNSKNRRDHIKYVLRGSPSFGSKRLLLSEAEFIFHGPSYYDVTNFSEIILPGMYKDVGDMAGIGNKVLLARDGVPGKAFQFFFDVGKAIDDKADMYYSYATQGSVGSVVPFEADGDNYGDVLISDDAYTTEVDVNLGKSNIGTIQLVHGSPQIPVHLNPKYSVVSRKSSEGILSVFPNPANEKTQITFQTPLPERINFTLHDLLGRTIKHWVKDSGGGVENILLYTADLPSGTYVLDFESASQRILQKISIMH